jgi:hypothetical protein
MNFQELLTKMAELDQPVQETKRQDPDAWKKERERELGDETKDTRRRYEPDEADKAAEKARQEKKRKDLDAAMRSTGGDKWGGVTRNGKKVGEGSESVQEEKVFDEDDMEEGNEFSGALARAKAAGKKEFTVNGKTYQVKEDIVDECGMPMTSSSMEPPKQQDSVSMNVSMNGSGSGGIKDLMQILRNIENNDNEPENFGDKDMDIIVKKMPSPMIDDNFGNEPDEMYQGFSSVMKTGNDLHSKGKEAPKVNGGGNPMSIESGSTFKLPPGDLKLRLESLYSKIKSK